MDLVDNFNEYRSRMNDKIMEADNIILKRLFNLDTNCYTGGSVDVITKEMIGLSCSMVLRCDDCVRYHLGKCHELGVTTQQVFLVFEIAKLIGCTIVIPHLLRSLDYFEALEAKQK